MRRCLVLGANGHIGIALVNYLKAEGSFVRGVGRGSARHIADADEYNRADLRFDAPPRHFEGIDEVYQLAAEVGGLGYLMDQRNDLKILTANTLIARFPFLPPFPFNLRPRFVRLLFSPSSGGSFTAGTIASALVTLGRDDYSAKYTANNYKVQ